MKCNTATRGTSATVEVPAGGGDVEVRRIPPRLLRQIRAKATKGGRLDFQELMVWKLVYGLRHPNFTEAEARRVTWRFTLTALQPIVDRIDRLSGTDEHLRCFDDGVPQRLRRYAEQMVMATAWLKRFPDAPSRMPRTTRARGAGRPAGRRSSKSSRAGPGDDGEQSDPSPEKPCACGCGADVSHRASQAKYLTDAHAAAHRKRRERSRNRDWSADVSRADPYLRHEPEEVARARRRVEEGCRCNGHHIPDPEDHHCIKCGHDRAHGAVFAGFNAARSVETRRPRRSELVA